jgi:predicted nucleic acid-binding protein
MLIDNQRWIWVQAASNRTLITMLEQDLDEGEAEAIALTLEVSANYLIIDEAKGRAIAEKMGIKIIGLLGTLVKAKQQGLLLEIKPIMEHLATLGFRIRPSLFNQILKIVGESTK